MKLDKTQFLLFMASRVKYFRFISLLDDKIICIIIYNYMYMYIEKSCHNRHLRYFISCFLYNINMYGSLYRK